MANMCSNTLDVSGNDASLQELYSLIEKQDEVFLSTYYFFKTGDYYGLVDGTLDELKPGDRFFGMSFTSKWSPPLDEIQALSTLYPKLEFKVTWEEPAMEVFGDATINAGTTIVNDMEAHDYYLENNDNYAAEYARIQESSPEDLIKDLVKNGMDNIGEDTYPMNLLQHILVTKIKDEDLPLIINFEWDDNVMETIKERLTGCPAQNN